MIYIINDDSKRHWKINEFSYYVIISLHIFERQHWLFATQHRSLFLYLIAFFLSCKSCFLPLPISLSRREKINRVDVDSRQYRSISWNVSFIHIAAKIWLYNKYTSLLRCVCFFNCSDKWWHCYNRCFFIFIFIVGFAPLNCCTLVRIADGSDVDAFSLSRRHSNYSDI